MLPAFQLLRSPALLAAAALLLAPGAVRPDVVAFAAVQDRAGDPALVEVVEAAVRQEVAQVHRLVDATTLRDALRRGRIRAVDKASGDALAELAADTGADWVLSVTLHQSLRDDPPRVALSGRAWNLPTGELRWAGFAAGSGLDRRRLLGLGVIHDPERLAAAVTERLASDLLDGATGSGGARAPALGPIALVPLGSVTERAGTTAAETATEIVRAQLHRHGAEVVPSGCVISVLRRQGRLVWGGVDAEARGALREGCGARFVITGQVESYEVGGTALEPEPEVALALRLIDADTGRIVWLDALERDGRDRVSVFNLGRIYTRGTLAERMTETLMRRLLAEVDPSTDRQERNR